MNQAYLKIYHPQNPILNCEKKLIYNSLLCDLFCVPLQFENITNKCIYFAINNSKYERLDKET